MDYDFLRLSPMLVLIMSLGMIIPSRSISVGVIEGSDEELTLPEYDDTRELGKDDLYKTNSTTCSDYYIELHISMRKCHFIHKI